MTSSFKARLKACGFRGSILDDFSTRLLNATDNSIYELLPEGVIQPFDAADLKIMVAAANEAPFQHLTFTARGGGTGTNGQALNRGFVVDTSRYMTRILDFDAAKAVITVEPGIVLSELNRFLKPHGLFFAPSVSTADRATIGGMIATDAAGKGSLVYGKTSDHLANLDVVMITPGQTLADFENTLRDLLAPHQAEIKARFPTLKRPLSGYNLQQCFAAGRIDLNRLIAGSEGTLAFISAATLKLLPLPRYSSMITVQYPDFMAALKDAPFLIEQGPVAIEVVDDQVQRCVDGKTDVSNFIEFAEQDEAVLKQKINRLIVILEARGSVYQLIESKEEQAKIWGIRAAAVGLVARLPGSRKPIAFVEDAVVPPEHLCDFIAEFQTLLKSHDLQYAMYGHTDVGCIHVRPALDLKTPQDREKIRLITEVVFVLTQKYHGLLWGEHGKGFRGEFVQAVFGPVLYATMAKIKAWFDPHNRLNPGKLVTPSGNPAALDRIDNVPMRGQLDASINPALQEKYAKAMICNGNAACFNRAPNNVMCPSYKVTNDRVHSPKGRAMLIKEWLRVQSKLPDSKETLAIADATFTAMNGCLGCKGCTGKCPVTVSIPDLRSSFLETYYRLYRKRPLRDYVMGWVEDLLPFIAHIPRLWNMGIRTQLLPTFGLKGLPLLPLKQTKLPFQKRLKPVQLQDKAVVILADVFTSTLDQNVLLATYHSLQKMGLTPYVLSPRASGKSLLVNGFLDSFKRKAKQWTKQLNPLFEAGIPVIGLENSLVLMFRDEFQKFGQQTLAGKVWSLGEYFQAQLATLPVRESLPQDKNSSAFCLLPHCTEQALLPQEAKAWQAIFAHFNLNLSVENAGCCGMAGLYGYQKEHLENSQNLFALHWQSHIDNLAKTILATGFSCRAQTKRFSTAVPQHPVEVLHNILEQINKSQSL